MSICNTSIGVRGGLGIYLPLRLLFTSFKLLKPLILPLIQKRGFVIKILYFWWRFRDFILCKVWWFSSKNIESVIDTKHNSFSLIPKVCLSFSRKRFGGNVIFTMLFYELLTLSYCQFMILLCFAFYIGFLSVS